MHLQVDTSSPVPPYEQIRAQLQTMVTSGALPEGTRLPPIRQLAGDLGLATNTVGRAYHELELEGLVETRGRHGTVVRSGHRPWPHPSSRKSWPRRPRPSPSRPSTTGPASTTRWARCEQAFHRLREGGAPIQSNEAAT